MKDEIKEIINLGHEAEKIEFSKGGNIRIRAINHHAQPKNK